MKKEQMTKGLYVLIAFTICFGILVTLEVTGHTNEAVNSLIFYLGIILPIVAGVHAIDFKKKSNSEQLTSVKAG
jgi:hypothetical protein